MYLRWLVPKYVRPRYATLLRIVCITWGLSTFNGHGSCWPPPRASTTTAPTYSTSLIKWRMVSSVGITTSHKKTSAPPWRTTRRRLSLPPIMIKSYASCTAIERRRISRLVISDKACRIARRRWRLIRNSPRPTHDGLAVMPTSTTPTPPCRTSSVRWSWTRRTRILPRRCVVHRSSSHVKPNVKRTTITS